MNGVQIGWRIRNAKQSVLDAVRTIEELDGKDAEPMLMALDTALNALRRAEAAAIALGAKEVKERRAGERRAGNGT